MRFVIVGPGAIGSVIGATLAQGGHEVALLGRSSPHLEAIRTRGLQIRHLDGASEFVKLHATDDPEIASGADALIVLVKTVDTEAAMRAVAPHVNAGEIVLTLQNGLGNAARIRAAIGQSARLLVGVTSQAAMRLGPGSVVHAGQGPTLIGYDDPSDAEAASHLAAAFSTAGLPAAVVSDVERWVWQKVAVNAAINGLTALGGFENGRLAEDPDLLDSAEIIAEEAAAVARAKGIEPGDMRRAILETSAATTKNRSSMLQDVDTGRPTEVDAIQGAIVAAGREVGIATPANQVLAALIRTREVTRTE